MIKPIADWWAISDGYGYVGYAWDCKECGQSHMFVRPEKDEEYTCKWCKTVHISDFEEEE